MQGLSHHFILISHAYQLVQIYNQCVFFLKDSPPSKKRRKKKTTKQIDAHLTEVFLPVLDGITFERTYLKVYTENSDIYQRINDSKISV